jgi:hypothetical protein
VLNGISQAERKAGFEGLIGGLKMTSLFGEYGIAGRESAVDE